MGKTIWLMNHYANHMIADKGGRHYNFAKYLNRQGYKSVVFCANMVNNQPQKQFFDSNDLYTVHNADEISTPFVFVNVSAYSGNGIGRVKNMLSFYFNVKRAAKKYEAENGKPDYILASSVHPLTMIAGIQLAKRFKAKCICEVRDLWPEAIVAYSKRIKNNSLPAKIMYAGEKWIYTKADAVIFTQEGGPNYVCEHGWDRRHGGPIANEKLYHINNGVDLEGFNANIENYPYSDKDLDDPDFFKVVYTGSVRRINNLGLIIEAAKLVTDPKIRFLIFGDGDELESLRKKVAEEKLDNIIFKGRVDKYYIPSIVSKADLNLVHWEMSPLLRVGESYNKAFEYFAAGKPVFYTIRPGYSIVEKFNCGRITNGFEPKDIADGIQKMAVMSDKEKVEMSLNARKAAEAYDFKVLTKKLVVIMEST